MEDSDKAVSLDRIAAAPVEIPDTGSLGKAKQEAEYLAHQQGMFRKELGWMGHPFGGRSEKPGNISALVIILCFCAMGVVYFFPRDLGPGISLKEAFQSLMSVVTLILGYLFGSNDRAGKDT
jgi:hypothetical protein